MREKNNATQVKWAIYYVNGGQFIGRFDGYWTRGGIEAAARFDTETEADSALQALLEEGKERLSKSKEHWPTQFWWDVCGGLLQIVEIEIVTRVADRSVPA